LPNIGDGDWRRTDERKINIYPEALNELVGIKFVNNFSGKFLIPDFQYTRSDSFSSGVRVKASYSRGECIG
jgi:hypothetical protein